MEEFIEIEDNLQNITAGALKAQNPLKDRLEAETELGVYYEPLKNISHMIFILYLVLDMTKTNFIEQKAHRMCLHCALAGIEIILDSIGITETPMDFVENLLKKIGISPEELKIQ